MDSILQVDNLTKQYTDFKLDHVSFSVPKGTIMGLIGENGAGKSTTINAILDLIRKDDGTVTFWGQELSSSKQLKEDIGVVFDGINFYETLTPAKVGKIAGSAYKQWDAHLFQDYLKRFQLPTDKEIKSLSKGMKMKLCIAVALSHKPKLLILDEATSGLDPVMRDDMSIPLVFKFGAERGRVLLLVSFLIPAGICFGIYQLLTTLGIELTDQLVFILLCCSPLLALAWCYVMYQISYRIFAKQEL